jgi:hypothetical protein
VDDLRDFIDPDEGYRREIDFEVDAREAFFAYAAPCENCGSPCEETRPASWDPSTHVGPCCQFCLYEHIPETEFIACPSLEKSVLHCKSVREVSLAFSFHLAECPTCQERRRLTVGPPVLDFPVQRKTRSGETEWVWSPRKSEAA